MKATFSGSTERCRFLSSTRQHTEILRSFNTLSNVKEQQTNIVQSEEEEFEPYPNSGVYGSNKMKKPILNHKLSSSTPHNSVAMDSRTSTRKSSCVIYPQLL